MQLSKNKRDAKIDWAVLVVFHDGRESCKLRWILIERRLLNPAVPRSAPLSTILAAVRDKPPLHDKKWTHNRKKT